MLDKWQLLKTCDQNFVFKKEEIMGKISSERRVNELANKCQFISIEPCTITFELFIHSSIKPVQIATKTKDARAVSKHKAFCIVRYIS